MQKWLLSSVFLGVILLAASCMIPPIQPTGATTRPIKGAAGLGDKFFPNAGNGGYDVQHYDLDLTVDVASNTITSTATLTVLATSTLDTFNLDFHELTIDTLVVNGIETLYQREEDELVIDPAASLEAGRVFSVTVHYHGRPKLINTSGWLNYFDRVAVENEALGAATWYPVNNHPADKATYSYRVTVPPSYMALANGQLLGEETDARGWTTYRWATDSPMASANTTLMIDRYVLQSSATSPSGVLLHTYTGPYVQERTVALFDQTPAMLALLEELVGPYPFANYGVLIHTKSSPYIVFRQELAIFSQSGLSDYGEEAVMNGLAFQYFGQSVGIAQWQDAWLAQGLGGYLGWFWIEKSRGPEALQTMVQRIHNGYNLDFPPAAPSTGDDLENDSIYFRAPMAIYALRMHLGDERFFQLLHTFYTRYRGGNASTADFIAVAEEVSGEDLTAFFQAWLYDDKLPPLLPAGLALNHDPAEVSLVDWVEDFAQESYTEEELLQVGRTFTYTIPLRDERPLFWTQQWCAKDETTLRENVEVINWRFSINDTLLPIEHFSSTFIPLYGAYCHILQTQVTHWPSDSVKLKAVVTIEQPLNNGYADYPAGAQTFLAVVTQQPATTNRETTAVDCALRSRISRKLISLTFHNDSTRTINAYWLDFEGKEVYYFTLHPRTTYTQQTYVTHPWCLRDAETKEAVLAVTAEDQAATVEIR